MKEYNQNTFLLMRLIPYWIFASIWFIGSFGTVLLFLKKGLNIKLMPVFLESLMIKNDWLGIIIFPIIAVLIMTPTFYVSSRYKWFTRRVSYSVRNGTINISSKKCHHSIPVSEIKCTNCRIRKSLFPIRGRGTPMDCYYDLLIELPSCAYKFTSTLFHPRVGGDEDFLRFLNTLKDAGITMEIPELNTDNWIIKLLKKYKK